MDITLQVVIDAPAHAIRGDAKIACRYRAGDIVGVYLSDEILAPPNPSTRMGFVHITNAPDTYSFNTIKRVLTQPIITTHGGVDRRRAWRIPPSILPISARTTLINDREISYSWAQARPYVRKKLVVSLYDPSQDDEDTALVDEDLNG